MSSFHKDSESQIRKVERVMSELKGEDESVLVEEEEIYVKVQLVDVFLESGQ